MHYTFGDHYTLDSAGYELRQHGRLVRLEPQVFDVLAYLVQHPDRTVTKEELVAQLWPQPFVADDALTQCVARVRKALGDTGQMQRYIQTVRRRGYRFIAPVTLRPPVESSQDAAAVSPPAVVQAAPPSGVPPAPDLARAPGPGGPSECGRHLGRCSLSVAKGRCRCSVPPPRGPGKYESPARRLT